MAAILFTYALPLPCLPPTMPYEIMDLISSYALNASPKAHLPLLLTSKHVNHVVSSISDTLARRQARQKHPLAASLFSPRSGENLLGSWLPRLSDSVRAIESTLHRCKRFLIRNILHIHDLDAASRILRIGLYLLETLYFSEPHDTARVHLALSALPAYGVLIIRFTSVVLTMVLSDLAGESLWCYDSYAPRTSRPEDRSLDARNDFEIFTLAVENLLLADGISWFAETTLWLVVADAISCRRIDCARRKGYRRERALETVKEGVKLLCWCRHRGGVLRGLRRDEVVSERLRMEYGDLDLVSVAWGQWERVRVMMRMVGEEIAGREQGEVLRELKVASGL